MTPAELYARFRSDVQDEKQKYLWKPEEVWGYMAEAEDMFCRLIGGLNDSTSALTELEVTEGEATAAWSSRILECKSASLRSTGQDVSILNYEDLTKAKNTREYTRQYMDEAGPVKAIVLGMDENLVRFVQTPDADDTIDLHLARLPLKRITLNSSKFEIAEHHHLSLLFWMEHLAYSKQDAETLDKAKAKEKKADFIAYCAQAKAEKAMRKNKVRVVAYGGI